MKYEQMQANEGIEPQIGLSFGELDYAALPLVVLRNPGKSISDLKSLMRMWDKGTFNSISGSIRYHFGKHGTGDVLTYLRKAANFNTKGANTKVLTDGAIRYTRKSGEYIIKRNGKIVSYGTN